MTDIDKKEIRGLTMPLIRTFITGTFIVCSTVIGAAVYIQTSFANHELRITNCENWQAEHEKSNKDSHTAIWAHITEMDNRIYGLTEHKSQDKN